MVLDNLNPHFRGSFVEVLGEGSAGRFLERVEFHYPPKHASWLNMAEIVALACSQPPAGAKRWTLRLLVQAARDRPKLAGITQESVRQFLKKTSASPGAK